VDISYIADRYFDAWNSHDAVALLGVFGRKGIFHGPFARQGISGTTLANYASGFWNAFPDFYMQTEAPLLGRTKATVEWALRGTHDGQFFGCAPSGRRLVLRGVEIIDIGAGGGLVARSCCDVPDLVQQLGLVGSPIFSKTNEHPAVPARDCLAQSSPRAH
jgi:hypothetical protein